MARGDGHTTGFPLGAGTRAYSGNIPITGSLGLSRISQLPNTFSIYRTSHHPPTTRRSTHGPAGFTKIRVLASDLSPLLPTAGLMPKPPCRMSIFPLPDLDTVGGCKEPIIAMLRR